MCLRVFITVNQFFVVSEYIQNNDLMPLTWQFLKVLKQHFLMFNVLIEQHALK